MYNKEIPTINITDWKHRGYLHKPTWTHVEMNTNHNITFSFFLDRLLLQLDETEKAFNQFWSEHHLKLNQCLQLQHFEHNFREVLFSCVIELPFMVQWLLVLSSPLDYGYWVSPLTQPAPYILASSLIILFFLFQGGSNVLESHFPVDIHDILCMVYLPF